MSHSRLPTTPRRWRSRPPCSRPIIARGKPTLRRHRSLFFLSARTSPARSRAQQGIGHLSAIAAPPRAPPRAGHAVLSRGRHHGPPPVRLPIYVFSPLHRRWQRGVDLGSPPPPPCGHSSDVHHIEHPPPPPPVECGREWPEAPPHPQPWWCGRATAMGPTGTFCTPRRWADSVSGGPRSPFPGEWCTRPAVWLYLVGRTVSYDPAPARVCVCVSVSVSVCVCSCVCVCVCV